jgi:hypothetical protein
MAGSVAPAVDSTRPDSSEPDQPQVVLGAVTTGLLNTSEPLPLDAARQVLALVRGVQADWRRYPVEQVFSPDLFLALDCRLPVSARAQPRIIGTARARAILTAGHILQGSARVDILLGASSRRKPWSHYMARVGVAEAINKARPADIVDGFLEAQPGKSLLDLGNASAYVMSLLDQAPQIDRRARLKTQAHRLLWAAHIQQDAEPTGSIVAGEDGVFRVRMSGSATLLPDFVEFCEILALHHWLLATLKHAFDRSNRRGRRAEGELDPALSYLGHVWNPTAHLPRAMQWFWDGLEAEAQLSWEWQTTLTRVRDKVSLLTRKAIEETLSKEVL